MVSFNKQSHDNTEQKNGKVIPHRTKEKYIKTTQQIA